MGNPDFRNQSPAVSFPSVRCLCRWLIASHRALWQLHRLDDRLHCLVGSLAWYTLRRALALHLGLCCDCLNFVGMDDTQQDRRAQRGYTATRAPSLHLSSEEVIRRTIMFECVAFPDTPIRTSIVRWIVSLSAGLRLRKALYLSVDELVRIPEFRLWGKSSHRVYDAFDDLARSGYLVRSVRERKDKKGHVTVWGLSGKGKGLIRQFDAYLSGEYDDRL